jgi:rhodanese-related sulfurtransferase/rubrerythrin
MRWKELFTPAVNLDAKEAEGFIREHREGTFTLLDVRQPSEYEKTRIPGAQLIPLPELGDRIGEIDPEKPVIVYCAVGGRSRAAAQFLQGRGFRQVFNLKGGIKAWQGHAAAGPAEMGMAALKGDETAAQAIVTAYALEAGLAEFYRQIAVTSDDPDVSALLHELAGIEDLHKDRLFALYADVQGEAPDRTGFESNTVFKAMEGGYTSDAFIRENRNAMATTSGVLAISMMLEAQGMDLYMRYAEKSADQKTRDIFLGLAEDEKAHLQFLATLMEREQRA